MSQRPMKVCLLQLEYSDDGLRTRKRVKKGHMYAWGRGGGSIGLKVQVLTATQRAISERKGTVTSNSRLL